MIENSSDQDRNSESESLREQLLTEFHRAVNCLFPIGCDGIPEAGILGTFMYVFLYDGGKNENLVYNGLDYDYGFYSLSEWLDSLLNNGRSLNNLNIYQVIYERFKEAYWAASHVCEHLFRNSSYRNIDGHNPPKGKIFIPEDIRWGSIAGSFNMIEEVRDINSPNSKRVERLKFHSFTNYASGRADSRCLFHLNSRREVDAIISHMDDRIPPSFGQEQFSSMDKADRISEISTGLVSNICCEYLEQLRNELRIFGTEDQEEKFLREVRECITSLFNELNSLEGFGISSEFYNVITDLEQILLQNQNALMQYVQFLADRGILVYLCQNLKENNFPYMLLFAYHKLGQSIIPVLGALNFINPYHVLKFCVLSDTFDEIEVDPETLTIIVENSMTTIIPVSSDSSIKALIPMKAEV